MAASGIFFVGRRRGRAGNGDVGEWPQIPCGSRDALRLVGAAGRALGTRARLGSFSPVPDWSRRFPPPWRTEKAAGGYVVRDATGLAPAYICSRETEADAGRQRCSRRGATDRHRRRAVLEPLGTGGAIDAPGAGIRTAQGLREVRRVGADVRRNWKERPPLDPLEGDL